MSGIMSHGLSALMEAVNHSKRANDESNQLTAMFEEAIDDDIIRAVTGKDEDSVETDMDGEGIGEDDEEMEALLSKIPPSDDLDEENLDALEEACESLIPEELR